MARELPNQATRKEIKASIAKQVKEITHSDQTALGISTDDALDAIQRGREAGK
jgi:hypothetical protein